MYAILLQNLYVLYVWHYKMYNYTIAAKLEEYSIEMIITHVEDSR